MNFFDPQVFGFITSWLDQIYGALIPLSDLVENTPLKFTTDNAVVHGAWMSMVGVADSFLGLYIIMKMIQMMHGTATGTPHMPMGQFVPRVILTVLLIHTSSFLGTEFIAIINALCDLLQTNLQDLIRQVNGGQLFNTSQANNLSVVFSIAFGFNMVRVIFQAIKRIALWNVLFALSGPALLMSLDEQTSPWFQFWFKMFLVTGIEQFFQTLTINLGIQFLLSAGTTGFTGEVMAVAILNLATEIPSLMSRFASSSGSNVGFGSLIRGVMTAAALLV